MAAWLWLGAALTTDESPSIESPSKLPVPKAISASQSPSLNGFTDAKKTPTKLGEGAAEVDRDAAEAEDKKEKSNNKGGSGSGGSQEEKDGGDGRKRGGSGGAEEIGGGSGGCSGG